MHNRILQLCLDIFELNERVANALEKERKSPNRHNSCRKVYPDAKIYYPLASNQSERWRMVFAGDRWRVRHCTALGKICYFGDFSLFKCIISDIARCLNKCGKHLNFNIWLECESELSLLHLTLFGRRDLVISRNNGVWTRTPDTKGEHIQIAKYLIRHGLDINIQNKWGYSVLNEAVINVPDLEFAKFILKHGANPNQYNVFGSVALLDCITQSQIESIKLLCDYGADPRLSEMGSGLTSIALGQRHIEAECIIYNALTKINHSEKSIGKHRTQEQELEYENPSYCCVCGIASKIQSLYQCMRCHGPKRYCSRKCQKTDWTEHKSFCYKNRRKPVTKEKEIIFNVITEQQVRARAYGHSKFSRSCFVGSSLPQSIIRSEILEQFAEKHLNKRNMELPKYQKRYRNKINKQYSQTSTLNNDTPIKYNYKFPVKIQIPMIEDKSSAQDLYCYNKSRKYCVYISRRKQKKKYNELKTIIETKSAVGNKAYLYAYVDRRKRLHVITSQLLAMQPW